MTPPRSDTPVSFETPRLEVRWQTRSANFFESCRAALLGPRPSLGFNQGFSFFRLRISPRRAPGRGIAGSLISHIVLLSILIPLGRLAEPPPKFSLPRIQITWYGPATDVAPTPAHKASVPKAPLRRALKPKRPIVARAYNSHTTVVFRPPRASNSRQVLIEPDEPPTAPKILPSLPNIISWAAAAPIQPEITVNPAALLALKRRARPVTEATAPQLASVLLIDRPLGIVPLSNATIQPPIPLAPGTTRAERSKTQPKSMAAPTVAFAPNRLGALSLAPGKALPPPGNASAPISIGPRVGKIVSSAPPNVPNDTGPGADGTLSASAATPGPAGLLILHGGTGPAPPPAPRAPAPRPSPRIARPSPLDLRPPAPSRAPSPAGGGSGIVPHDLAHEVLGMRPIHTLLMNMPNLTSATGSWVLDFAELPGEKIPLGGNIVAPLPIRKVDPEYPPELIQEGVQGEVVLYAVIGKDGTVSHIRVVKSLDPVLDRNAETAFAEWKFEPALADNHPIALEVLVHIPFLYKVPR